MVELIHVGRSIISIVSNKQIPRSYTLSVISITIKVSKKSY